MISLLCMQWRREMTQRHHVTRHMTCPYSIGPVHRRVPRTRVLRVRVGNGSGVRGTEGKIPLGYYPCWLSSLVTSQNFTQFSTAPTAPSWHGVLNHGEPSTPRVPTPRVRSQTRESLSASSDRSWS